MGELTRGESKNLTGGSGSGEFRRGTGGAGNGAVGGRFGGEPDAERLSGEAVRLSGEADEGRFKGTTVDFLAGSSTRVDAGKGTGADSGEILRLLATGVGGRTGCLTGVAERSIGAGSGAAAGAGAIPPPGAATSPTRAATVG